MQRRRAIRRIHERFLRLSVSEDGAATHYDCYSTAKSPRLWQEAGDANAGLANAQELATRMKTAADWMLSSCRSF